MNHCHFSIQYPIIHAPMAHVTTNTTSSVVRIFPAPIPLSAGNQRANKTKQTAMIDIGRENIRNAFIAREEMPNFHQT